VLQVTDKRTDPATRTTRVEFKSLWETRSEGTRSLHSGLSNSGYYMTKPEADVGIPGLVGQTTAVPGNLGDTSVQARVHFMETLAAELQSAGRAAEADQVRDEIRRIQKLTQSKP
jgi:hypothetical protein